MLHALVEGQPYDLARLTFFLFRLSKPDQAIVNCHAANHENDQWNVDPAHDPCAKRTGICGSSWRYQSGRQVDLAPRKIRTSADMTLPARLRQIVCTDHRLGIGGGQDVVNAVTTSAVRNYFRTPSGCEAMVTITITTDTFTRNSEFLRKRHAFVAACAGVGGHCCRSVATRLFDRRPNAVDAVTVGTNWRSRYATRDSLSMNTLHELCALTLVALTTRGRDVDLGNR